MAQDVARRHPISLQQTASADLSRRLLSVARPRQGKYSRLWKQLSPRWEVQTAVGIPDQRPAGTDHKRLCLGALEDKLVARRVNSRGLLVGNLTKREIDLVNKESSVFVDQSTG